MIATREDCNPSWVPWSFTVETWQTSQGSLGFIRFVKHFGTVILDQSTRFLSWVGRPKFVLFFHHIAFFAQVIEWLTKPLLCSELLEASCL
jgi:hypothetical protein